ncbi:MAG: TonB-dependent receptor [Bacteroidales bacterium]|nr:TonB-dependent receptor [Bacteroidales bacterium]
MPKLFRILGVIFLLPLTLLSQEDRTGGIRGSVADSISGRVLTDAHILIEGRIEGTISGKDGTFRISGLEPGEYTISVRFVGYHEFRQNVCISPKRLTDLKILLHPQIYSHPEVTVNADMPDERLEQPMRLEVIPAGRIDASPVGSLPQMLEYVSGVNMNNTLGIFSSRTVVTLRGLPADEQSRTLILIDGMPLNKTDEGSVNWNMINMREIGEVRITKGPGPVKYGSGAMGGVIDIITRKPEKPIEGSLQLDYGTYDTYAANLHLSGMNGDTAKTRNLNWSLTGFGRSSEGYVTVPDQYRTAGDTILEPTYLREMNTSLTAGYDFGNGHNIIFRGRLYDDRRSSGVRVFEDWGAYQDHDTYYGMGSYSGRGRSLNWQVILFWLDEYYKRQYEFMNEGEYQLYLVDARRRDRGGDMNISFTPAKGHLVSAGISHKRGSVDASDTYYTSTDIISNAGKMDVSAIYLQEETSFMDGRIIMNMGLRYDFATYFDGLFTIEDPSYSIGFIEAFENRNMETKRWDALCPRASIQYHFNRECRIYLSAAKGFRAPILDDLTRTGKKKGTFKVANPGLGPELIHTLDAGGDVTLFRILSASLSAYYSNGKDFMYYSSTGDSVNMGYRIAPVLKMKNISNVDVRGIEVDLRMEPIRDKWSFFINYSFAGGRIRDHDVIDPGSEEDLTGKYLTDIPDHKWAGGATWNNRWINTTVLFRYIGKRWINDLNVIDEEYLLTDRYDGYSTWNVRMERRIGKHLAIRLTIENIFDEIYIEQNLNQCPGRFVIFSARFSI